MVRISKYSALFVSSLNKGTSILNEGITDENELTQTLGLQIEEKGKLHSIVPKIKEGTTVGYMLIFEDE
ncbi:hypothetical protein [Bacillus sp. FJAT-49736]|uniref:hypothetical protein n=1 Tax=Bacillus sp. FJAT-49736 TaxID=2833582 RepID=UPI001BCA2662|nr:hypothetical protein [Bacillus sp. FJAT-49736]MBS4171928.1 hypothetical protein [Bacillus sp. FJAT-49736]